MTAELVGPLPVVRFRDGTTLPYAVPRHTGDGERWQNCTEHRVACDCREAELAEQISEYRATLKAAVDACRAILEGHATYAYEPTPDGGQREIGCACTGCQIARKVHLLASYEAGPSARDQVFGLSDAQIESGYRWRICTPVTLRDFQGACEQWKTRMRGHYHEHLHDPGGRPVLLPEFDPYSEVPF